MASVRSALEIIKSDPTEFLTSDLIVRSCQQAGHKYRNRVLGPVQTIQAMLKQTVHDNASIGEVVRLYQGAFTASAYCQACQRVPLEVFFRLFHEQNKLVQTAVKEPESAWHGHRVYVADSTGFSMCDEGLLAEYFGYPANQRPGCGFPVGRMMLEIDPYSGLGLDFIPAPLHTGEAALLPLMQGCLQLGAIALADGNFGTASMVQVAQSRGVHLIAEVQVMRKVKFACDPVDRPGKRRKKPLVLPDADEIMEWDKPAKRPAWMDEREYAALPETTKVRVIRHDIVNEGCRKKQVVLVTTLLDQSKYPAAEIAELYKLRWRVETCFKTIKHTLKLDVLRSHTPDGVLKELVMIMLVYNLVRLVMLQAAKQQNVPPVRISFIDALRWLRYAKPGDELPTLNIIPLRPRRNEPRVRKRRAKAYPLMQTPRSEYHKNRKSRTEGNN